MFKPTHTRATIASLWPSCLSPFRAVSITLVAPGVPRSTLVCIPDRSVVLHRILLFRQVVASRGRPVRRPRRRRSPAAGSRAVCDRLPAGTRARPPRPRGAPPRDPGCRGRPGPLSRYLGEDYRRRPEDCGRPGAGVRPRRGRGGVVPQDSRHGNGVAGPSARHRDEGPACRGGGRSGSRDAGGDGGDRCGDTSGLRSRSAGAGGTAKERGGGGGGTGGVEEEADEGRGRGSGARGGVRGRSRAARVEEGGRGSERPTSEVRGSDEKQGAVAGPSFVAPVG